MMKRDESDMTVVIVRAQFKIQRAVFDAKIEEQPTIAFFVRFASIRSVLTSITMRIV
jgi:hypothetical protein